MLRWLWAFIPSSRARPRCWIPMSASVQTVDTRTTEAPASWAARRSSLVPIPGSRAVAIRLRRHHLGGGGDQVGVRAAGEAVLARAGAEAVAVADGHRPDAGVVECSGHRRHLLGRELVRDRVRAVADGGVDDFDRSRGAHHRGALAAAIISATRTAAQVMMSRLPAYSGR